MSISPGKVGELLKSYLIKERFGIQFSKTIPIIIVERIAEFISLIILGVIGLLFLEISESTAIIFFSIGFLIVLLLISNKFVLSKIVYLLSKLRSVKGKIKNVKVFESSLTHLFELKNHLITLFFSLIAWIFECFAFYIIITDFAEINSFIWSIFVYLVAILVGAVSMLPGGIGSTEASLTFLITQNGIAENIAIGSTILIRVFTLWFSVLIGFISLIIFYRRKEK